MLGMCPKWKHCSWQALTVGTLLQVAPSIGVVRFLYEGLMQWWGVGGIHKFRQRSGEEDDADSSFPSV